MKTTYLLKRSGDPFVDTGALVIEYLWTLPMYKDKDVLELIEAVAKIYVNTWGAKINSLFLNHPITQPAFDATRKILETVKYYRSLITGEAVGEEGYCRILGLKGKVFSAGRNNFMMTGSGTFMNFHHGFEAGLMLSKEAIIRLFFVPLGNCYIGKHLANLSSNLGEIEKQFAIKIIKNNFSRIASNSSDGVLKSEFSNPANAIFDFAKFCIIEHDLDDNETVELNLFHYNNIGTAPPEIYIYNFSSQLFDFYRVVLRRFSKDWQRFAHSFHRTKDAVYLDGQDQFEIKDKKESKIVQFFEFQTWYNSLYSNLLAGHNIRKDFLDYSRRQYDNERQFSIYPIVSLYQKYIINMKEVTLKKIEEIADFIIIDDGKLKKRLSKLRAAKYEGQIREFLLDLIKDKYEKQEAQPLIRLREYINDLFPDGTYGSEIRDLLLISLYEKLADKSQFIDAEENNEETLSTR